jgi:hypothetical protein
MIAKWYDGTTSNKMAGRRTFTGSAEDADVMEITIRNTLATSKVLSAIRPEGNDTPKRDDYSKEYLYKKACREQFDTEETAFVMIFSMIAPGLQLCFAVEHLFSQRNPVAFTKHFFLFDLLRNVPSWSEREGKISPSEKCS